MVRYERLTGFYINIRLLIDATNFLNVISVVCMKKMTNIPYIPDSEEQWYNLVCKTIRTCITCILSDTEYNAIVRWPCHSYMYT